LKNTLPRARKFDFVDIDGDLLTRFAAGRVNPLICDHIMKRVLPLTVNVWKGDVALPNPNFTGTDAVIAIEL